MLRIKTNGIKVKIRLPNIDINLDILSCLKTKKDTKAVIGNIIKYDILEISILFYLIKFQIYTDC